VNVVWFDLIDVARCGAWGRDQAMCARARAYLPVYRAFADTPGATWRTRVAIEALKDVGTNEDLLRLHRSRPQGQGSDLTTPLERSDWPSAAQASHPPKTRGRQ
jgi:hypothetical protein